MSLKPSRKETYDAEHDASAFFVPGRQAWKQTLSQGSNMNFTASCHLEPEQSIDKTPFSGTIQTEFPERYITLGLKIAYYRKKAGFTQESFAERIGKSVNFIAQVEGTGTVRGISLETLFKIAQVLNVAPSKLLEDD